jgi:hypothetical protein
MWNPIVRAELDHVYPLPPGDGVQEHANRIHLVLLGMQNRKSGPYLQPLIRHALAYIDTNRVRVDYYRAQARDHFSFTILSLEPSTFKSCVCGCAGK